jgi:hypothetical protein
VSEGGVRTPVCQPNGDIVSGYGTVTSRAMLGVGIDRAGFVGLPDSISFYRNTVALSIISTKAPLVSKNLFSQGESGRIIGIF